MDTIVLAGGSNERLKSVIPSFHKPLLVINGRPLVVDIVDKILQATSSSDRVIVVCSPHNVNAIADVVSHVALTGADEIDFVVQPQPIGIVDATVRGLRAADSEHVMVVCADNIIPAAVLKNMVRRKGDDVPAIATATVLGPAARRFTRVITDVDKGVAVDFIEDKAAELTEAEYVCWVGPVVMQRNLALKSLTFNRAAPSLSRFFSEIHPEWNIVHGDAKDVGIVDELMQFTPHTES